MKPTWRNPDEDGRYPLSYVEYQSLRSLFGAKNALEQTHNQLERRVRTIPGGWRDFRLLMTLVDKLLGAVLRTIPQKKLLQIRAELSRTVCEIKVQGVAGNLSDDKLLRMVPQGALETVVNESMSMKCFACERCDYKRCELFKAIESLYNYDFPKTKVCPLSEYTILPDEVRGDE